MAEEEEAVVAEAIKDAVRDAMPDTEAILNAIYWGTVEALKDSTRPTIY